METEILSRLTTDPTVREAPSKGWLRGNSPDSGSLAPNETLAGIVGEARANRREAVSRRRAEEAREAREAPLGLD